MLIKDKEPALFVDDRNKMQLNAPAMAPAANVRLTSFAVETKGDVLNGTSGTGLAIVLASRCVASTLGIEGADVETEDEVVES